MKKVVTTNDEVWRLEAELDRRNEAIANLERKNDLLRRALADHQGKLWEIKHNIRDFFAGQGV